MSEYWKFGFTKDSFKACESTMSAFAGQRPFVYSDGRVRGMRDIDSGTGSGLLFTLTGSGIGHWPSLV